MAIIWISGNSNSGKTTLAKQMQTKGVILLDGTELRRTWNEWDLSKQGRWDFNIKVANKAKELEMGGYTVIVSTICPYRKLRDAVQDITNCSFIYLGGGKKHKDYLYEIDKNKFYFRKCIK